MIHTEKFFNLRSENRIKFLTEKRQFSIRKLRRHKSELDEVTNNKHMTTKHIAVKLDLLQKLSLIFWKLKIATHLSVEYKSMLLYI